jgi:hypothetical protein
METFAGKVRRRSSLLLAALVAQSAVATIPEQSASRSTTPSATASSPVLVRLEPDAFAPADALTDAMNACVAGIVAREFAQASVSCDRAVRIARSARGAGSSAVELLNRRSGAKLLAAAVSNRAVLKWLTSDAGYAQDLERAKNLAPTLDFVKANLAVLGNQASSAVSVVAR